MDFNEKLKEFTEILKDDPRVKGYRDVAQKIESDEAKKKMVQDFRAIQIEAYQDRVKSGDVTEETKKKLENVVNIIQLNPEVSEFLVKEQEFSILFDEIMKSINDAIGIDIIG